MSVKDQAALAELATELEAMQAETFEIVDHADGMGMELADGCSCSSTSTSSTTSSTSSCSG